MQLEGPTANNCNFSFLIKNTYSCKDGPEAIHNNKPYSSTSLNPTLSFYDSPNFSPLVIFLVLILFSVEFRKQYAKSRPNWSKWGVRSIDCLLYSERFKFHIFSNDFIMHRFQIWKNINDNCNSRPLYFVYYLNFIF